MPRPKIRRRNGFTLIELMITVAIVGLLAAIAIPQYFAFLLRSKRAEIPMNADAIRTNEHAYKAEWGDYTSCALAPASMPGRTQEFFPATDTTDMDWNMLGWVPDGKVYGQYEVIADNQNNAVPTFIVNGYSDIDGDGNLAHWEGSESFKPAMTTENTIY